MTPAIHRVLTATAFASTSFIQLGGATAQDAPVFQGSALLILSDTDMPASAFVDGKLIGSDRDRIDKPDTLTVLTLPIRPAATPDATVKVAELPVSNSVVGPPYAMAHSPDGRHAYILETRGSAPKGTQTVPNVFAGLPAKSHVTVVDLADRTAPKVVEKIEVGSHTHTLSLRNDGRMLAVNTTEPGRNIVLRRIEADGRIGAEVAKLGIEVDGKPVRRVGRVEWHPSGKFLAIGLSFEDEIRFYRVAENDGRIRIEPWGAPVTVGDFPDEGVFTPDGQFYISTDLHWGDKVPPNYLAPPSGTFTVVSFDAEDGNHRVTGKASTSISPEGIAISPDGRFVVAANLMQSFMPWDDKRLTMGGSIDLLALDPKTGGLRHIANYTVGGVLPEGVTFDKSGQFVAATVFDRYDPRRRRGAVEFWRLIDGDKPRLERTNYEIEVAPGPHTLLLIP